ncbi:MAG: sulfatase-like hydrolase/transferase [Lachnospiraceae bacterium]
MMIHKPDGYSANAAEEIAAPYRSETSSGNAKTPNVIAIMDEAFADLQAVGDFRTSEDVMPFYHSLTKNTVKGFSYVSVFGGQTANTEFEFLTGLSKAFVPASATPYQLYIKSLLPGLTTHLGNQDYQGMLAFHPFRANGYNRDHVYPNLGFSDFISLKDLDVSASDKIRNFVSDAADLQ